VRNLPPARHPDLLVGIEGSDDAGVFRISPDLALVQTVDYFTPIVDDARDWGRIAAANALSDVYAMGGIPVTALQMVGWPRDTLPLDLIGEVMEGALEVLAEAGCTLVGGHSIDSPEPIFGLSVTGFVHPDRVVTNAGARAGDRLVLTKPIGTGIIATAIKRGDAPPGAVAAAVAAMTELNAGAAAAMTETGVHAATDVTGFGLLGHLGEMVVAPGLAVEVHLGAVPLLPDVRDLVAAGAVPGGTRRNLAAVTPFTDFGAASLEDRLVLADAQTSGGLLIAVPAGRVDDLLAALARHRTPAAAVIGSVTGAATGGSIVVTP
jgi:selenide, water dikinase